MRIRLAHTDAFRLAAIYTLVFAISIGVLGISVVLITRDALDRQILQFAQADMAAVASGYRSEGVHEASEVMHQRLSAPSASDYFLLQQNGRKLVGNQPAMAERIGTVRFTAGGREILGVGRLLAPGLYVFCGSDLAGVRATESRIVTTMSWLFLLALVVAAAGGAFVARAFLRRSDAMARACRAIMDGDLKARIPLRGSRDELDRLAETINEMLDRIAGLVENLRQVTNDVAHDLRTPVTHLRHGLERALQGGDHAAALDTAIRETDAILELFAALLRIAQIEGGARRAAFAAFDLKRLLGELQALFAPVVEESGHHLVLDANACAVMRGDRALVVQLFSNLIENAVLHTPAGTTITVALAAMGDQVRVLVGDNGPGVPVDEQPKLFRRFYRRESSRGQPGHGLGLALAAAIAELHGASLVIRNDRGPGLWFELVFARAPD